MASMADTKNPLDRAVELFVYAPIGLAVAARDLVPTLVERGRRQVDPQVGMARTIGHFAVARGRSQAEKALEGAIDRARVQAEATLRQLGILPEESPASSVIPDHEPQSPTRPPQPHSQPPSPPVMAHDAAPGPSATSPPGTEQPQPSAIDLSIPDYDSLSASQVLPRLSSLSTSELAAVRTYEEAHRGRKTILHRIAQLQA